MLPGVTDGEDSLWVSAELIDGDFAALVDAEPTAALRVATDDVEPEIEASAGGAAVVQVDADLVNVRSGPGTGYPVVATAGSADALYARRAQRGRYLAASLLSGRRADPGLD